MWKLLGTSTRSPGYAETQAQVLKPPATWAAPGRARIVHPGVAHIQATVAARCCGYHRELTAEQSAGGLRRVRINGQTGDSGMPAGISGPEERLWLRLEVLDDIVDLLERGSGEAELPGASPGALESGDRARVSLEPDIDALQDKIVRLIYGDVADDARELDGLSTP
jgi:hypothetical protein